MVISSLLFIESNGHDIVLCRLCVVLVRRFGVCRLTGARRARGGILLSNRMPLFHTGVPRGEWHPIDPTTTA